MIFIYRFSSSFPFPLSPCTAKLPRQILYTFSSWISLISSFFSQSFFFSLTSLPHKKILTFTCKILP